MTIIIFWGLYWGLPIYGHHIGDDSYGGLGGSSCVCGLAFQVPDPLNSMASTIGRFEHL